MGLDREVRGGLELSIDNFLKEPKESERMISIILRSQGIEPNLDAILSFIVGTAFGIVMTIYRIKYNRDMNSQEHANFLELMKRRAWELREAFIAARIEGPSEEE